MAGFIFGINQHSNFFKFYADVRENGLLYLFLSPVLYVLGHDTYFYWTHRLIHHPKLFRTFHRIHHRSFSPTPFTMYSFNFLEAVIESLYVPIMALFFPIHLYALVVLVFYSNFMNLIGHLGFELYGKWFWTTALVEIFPSTTYHHLHHQGGPNTHFGFYFRFWDRVCGTEDPRYAKKIAHYRALYSRNIEVAADEPREFAR